MNLNIKKNGINDRKKEMLFSGLGSLLTSGMDFCRAFRLLIDCETVPVVKSVLEAVLKSVIHGKTLWESFRQTGNFTSLDYGVVRIGEETGRLDESLKFLSEYYSRKIARHKMVTAAVSYPLIILVTAFLVLVFMILVIVPMFEQVYARMGGELPGITRWIISVSANFPVLLSGFVIVAALLGGAGWYYRKDQRIQKFIAGLILCLPAVGRLVRKSQQARFCLLLCLLYSSGVPLLKAIEMLVEIVTFLPYRQSLERIAREVRRGKLLASALELFPALYNKKLITLVRVGEETNRLGQMLRREGEEITGELEHELKQLGNLLEPVLILCVGSLVAVVLIAMYMPMFRLGGIMG